MIINESHNVEFITKNEYDTIESQIRMCYDVSFKCQIATESHKSKQYALGLFRLHSAQLRRVMHGTTTAASKQPIITCHGADSQGIADRCLRALFAGKHKCELHSPSP